MQAQFLKVSIGLPLILVYSLFLTSVQLFAADIEELPLCSPLVATTEQWNSHTGTEIRNSVFAGDVNYAETYNVGTGLFYGCASQLRMSLKQVVEGSSSYWISDKLVPIPGITTTVSVVDAGQGDGIIVGITFPAPITTFWPECFPGSGFASDTLCKEGKYPPNVGTGIMMYRYRDNNGAFTGMWTVAVGSQYFPGFVLRKIEECPPKSSYCPYEVIFRRGANGSPSNGRDVQVVLQMLVNIPETETGGGYNSNVAIPLFIRQSKSSSAIPTPTPTAIPTATPTTVQLNCIVPKLKGVTLKKAKELILNGGCALGKVTRAKSKTVPNGKVIKSAKVKALDVLPYLSPVDIVVSKGK